MMIPWATYTIFLIIAVFNNKSLINWILLAFTLLLLFWHISADLVTKRSHLMLRRGWNIFTFVAAALFLIIIIYQILSLDPIANAESTKNVINWLPRWITDNNKIIGLDDYTTFSTLDLAVKFLAYVAYFNLSVITKRQIEKSGSKIKSYQVEDLFEPTNEDSKDDIERMSSTIGDKDETMQVKFSLVYVVY
jgi:predicted PurR-regulated permease PerM